MNSFNSFDSKPFSEISVIGCGADTENTIRQVRQLGFSDVRTAVTDSAHPFPDTPANELAIVVATGSADRLDEVLAMLRRSETPSLLVTDRDPGLPSDHPVAILVVPHDRIFETVRFFLSLVFLQGPIPFTPHDFSTLFNRPCRVSVATAQSSDSCDRIDSLIAGISPRVSPDAETLTLAIFMNRDLEPQLKVGELAALNSFLSAFNKHVDVAWFVQFDPALPVDCISLTAFTTGPVCQL